MLMSTLLPLARLGNSGLKVSKIILGTMQYGSTGWQKWVIGEEEAIEHIKYAYVSWWISHSRAFELIAGRCLFQL